MRIICVDDSRYISSARNPISFFLLFLPTAQAGGLYAGLLFSGTFSLLTESRLRASKEAERFSQAPLKVPFAVWHLSRAQDAYLFVGHLCKETSF